MKAKTDQARSAKVAAWLNMLDHCEAQLQGLGALPEGRDALREAREQNETLSYNLKTLTEADKARKARAVARGRKSRETIAGLEREASRLRDDVNTNAERARRLGQICEERRLELLALAHLLGCDCVPHKMLEAVKTLQVAASAEGNECVRVRLPRNGETHISIDGETWHDQKTGRKV